MSLNPTHSLMPGGQVGNYTLVQKLRDGGMATLFLARRSGVHGFTRPVAIKVVHAHLSGQSEFVQMFVDEALLSSHLSHPNIVHVEEFGELDDGRCFLAMEYIDGCSLSEYSRYLRKREEGGDVVLITHIAIRTAEALHAAHDATDAGGERLRVVHRDVSPGNILLSRRGHIKVIDFGIAKSSIRDEHTVESLKGKLRYMSPEQARGHDLDARTDVYSLALVMWELLTARRAFNSKRDLALLDEVRDPNILAPSEYAVGIPPELDEVILKALSVDRDDRFENAMDFARALREALPSAGQVEASELAALVAAVPQRNVDRATMTSGSLADSTGTGRSAAGLIGSDRRDSEPPRGPLGVPSEFPQALDVAVDLDEPRDRKLLLALGAAGVMIAALLGILAFRTLGPATDAPGESAIIAGTPTAAAPLAPATSTAVPSAVPTAEAIQPVAPVVQAPAVQAPVVQAPAVQAPAVQAPTVPAATAVVTPSVVAPTARRWAQRTGTMAERPEPQATPDVDMAPLAATQRPRTQVGTTLLAGEDDEAVVRPRQPEETALRVNGTLLAE